MVHILLVILKFIGILLASILGLLLLLFLIILLAPFGYRAEGEAGTEKNRFQANISWLYVVIRGKIIYDERGLHWYLRLFGILFASNEEEFQKKQALKSEKRKQKKEKKEAAKKKKAAAKRKKELEARKQEDVPSQKQLEKSESQKVAEIETEVEKDVKIDSAIESNSEPAIKLDEKFESEAKESKLSREFEAKESKSSREFEAKDSKPAAVSKQQSEAENSWTDTWKTGFHTLLEKLLNIKKAIINFYTNGKSRLLSIPKKLQSIRQNLDNKLEKMETIREFWKREETQEVKSLLIRDGKKIVLHILPRRFKGHIEFGLEDPYRMGQILALLGMLLPLYQDKLTVTPDFEEQKLAGNFHLKGKVIPGYLLIKGAALLLNKNVRKTIKEGKQLIGGN